MVGHNTYHVIETYAAYFMLEQVNNTFLPTALSEEK